MSQPTLAVITFPGNNCEIETMRAASRSGFKVSSILWHELDKIGDAQCYVLPGGFSFEDRGRAGMIAGMSETMQCLRKEIRHGKLVLGICNGAQIVLEGGLMSIAGDDLPLALAQNKRRDAQKKVHGRGYYNTWVNLIVERKNTAFTNAVEQILSVPVAHGEGRFVTTNPQVKTKLQNGENVAFRYCDADGNVSTDFPITPNGSADAVAMVVNDSGTVGALMPHPERTPRDTASDQIWQSMHNWIDSGKKPATTASLFKTNNMPDVSLMNLRQVDNSLFLAKELLITDNTLFSIKQAWNNSYDDMPVIKREAILRLIFVGKKLTASDLQKIKQKIIITQLWHNPNKESLRDFTSNKECVLARILDNDEEEHLRAQLGVLLNKDLVVEIYEGWNFADKTQFQKAKDYLLSFGNPHNTEFYQLTT